MTHLEVENLASDYLEARLEAAPKAQFETHLEDCAPCRELVADLRRTVELCRAAEDLEPAPWLISKILLATVGQRMPTLREQLAGLFRPVLQPRVAYAVAMAVFSFSIIVNAARIDLRRLTVQDLDPRTWYFRANLAGHHLYARVEKYYYDLRVVYEFQSRFRRLRSEPPQEEKEAPKSDSQPGGSTDRLDPGNTQLARMFLSTVREGRSANR